MLRPRDLALIGILVITFVIAVVLGRRAGGDVDLNDPRTSTLLAGPQGSLALARALERLGVVVEHRRRPLFDVASRGGAGAGEVLALLNLTESPTGQELVAVSRYAASGGRVLVAGEVGVERCWGFAVTRADPAAAAVRVRGSRAGGALRLPNTHRVLRRASREGTSPTFADADAAGCAPLAITTVDTLLASGNGEPVAVTLHPGGAAEGGWVKLLADPAYLTNEALRQTDAGIALLPWIVNAGVERLVVDEYHHGFGRQRSIVAAAWGWLRTAPGGWAMLQLALAGLAALVVAAVRFGAPARSLERRRRSELEHLEALASGLERAGGSRTAVNLLIGGLRRRLGGVERGAAGVASLGDWVASLSLLATSPRVREAVGKLQSTEVGGDDRVLTTARAVEEIWRALRPGRQLETS